MRSEGLAIGLFVIGAAIGVVGGWINPPRNLSARTALGIFAALLIVAGAIVFLQTRPAPASKASSAPSTSSAMASSPPSVAASRFRRIGPADRGFSVSLSGTSVLIDAPDSDHHQWGVALPDHNWCSSGSISFDLRLDQGSG